MDPLSLTTARSISPKLAHVHEAFFLLDGKQTPLHKLPRGCCLRLLGRASPDAGEEADLQQRSPPSLLVLKVLPYREQVGANAAQGILAPPLPPEGMPFRSRTSTPD